jgi:hypothetical protein
LNDGSGNDRSRFHYIFPLLKSRELFTSINVATVILIIMVSLLRGCTMAHTGCISIVALMPLTHNSCVRVFWLYIV